MAKTTFARKDSKMIKQHHGEGRLTIQALDEMSSDEDGGYDEEDKEQWNAEAQALRQAISDGAFNHLLVKSKGKANFEERDRSEDGIDEEDRGHQDSDQDDWEDHNTTAGELAKTNEEDAGSDDESEDQEKDSKMTTSSTVINGKALAAVYDELQTTKKAMPWSEFLVVIPDKPLPFGGSGAGGSPLDIHDDLKRELAFYNMALDAANEARIACRQSGIPFSRPDDFFAEMVKTDDHMAKVKDRLIFETKKMDAVAQRKANKEQKLLSKEKATNKLLEKSNRKKEHFKAVDDWAKSAAQNRGPALREDDNAHLAKLTKKRGWTDRDGNLQEGPNKKRMAANTKYGHGGKTGRFKQNDPKSKNDMSAFNPKGNFGGMGSKSKGKVGAQRQGKRARDAVRSRR